MREEIREGQCSTQMRGRLEKEYTKECSKEFGLATDGKSSLLITDLMFSSSKKAWDPYDIQMTAISSKNSSPFGRVYTQNF